MEQTIGELINLTMHKIKPWWPKIDYSQSYDHHFTDLLCKPPRKMTLQYFKKHQHDLTNLTVGDVKIKTT